MTSLRTKRVTLFEPLLPVPADLAGLRQTGELAVATPLCRRPTRATATERRGYNNLGRIWLRKISQRLSELDLDVPSASKSWLSGRTRGNSRCINPRIFSAGQLNSPRLKP
jgi:hypothetical protein